MRGKRRGRKGENVGVYVYRAMSWDLLMSALTSHLGVLFSRIRGYCLARQFSRFRIEDFEERKVILPHVADNPECHGSAVL